MAIKTFTTGEVLTASDTNTYLANSGLVYITSATVGSGVTTVTVSSCFSATYDDYRIMLNGIDSSSLNNIVKMTLSNSSSTTYSSVLFYTTFAGSSGFSGATSTAAGFNVSYGGDVSDTNAVIDVRNPFASKRTTFTSQCSNNSISANGGGCDTSTNSSTGFTLSVSPDTLTGGTITVYGYRKA